MGCSELGKLLEASLGVQPGAASGQLSHVLQSSASSILSQKTNPSSSFPCVGFSSPVVAWRHPSAMHELSCHSLWCRCCPGTVVHSNRVGLAVLNEAIVKFFTSCFVKRDHRVVKMKVFEIFIPCLHGLGMENKYKTNKKPLQPPSPKAVWFMYEDGGWQGHGMKWHCPSDL